MAQALISLGKVARCREDSDQAEARFRESLVLAHELGHRPFLVQALTALGEVTVTQGQPERAARLFGAAEALREAMGAPLPPAERAEHDRFVAAARTTLGEAALTAAWAEGRAMSLPQAIEYALQPEGTATCE